MSQVSPSPQLRQLQVMAGALMSALVIIGIALAIIVPAGHGGRNTPVLAYLLVAAVGAAAAAAVSLIGYPALTRRSAPLEPAQVRLAFQTSMIMRAAIAETPALVSVALLFAFRADSVLPYVLGAAISLALMAIHVWPSTSLLTRVQDRMNRNGAQVDVIGTYRVR